MPASSFDVPAVETAPRPCWIGGHAEQGDEQLIVDHPYDGTEVATVAVPGPDGVERAVASAQAVSRELRQLPAHQRAAALEQVARGLSERAEELAETITAENGKPLHWSNVEVTRAIATFRFAAEETRRLGGQVQRLDAEPGSEGRAAVITRVPRGPVLAISPFNFPLNLVAHKVAPALAVGAPVLIKPAPRTPLSALILGELLADADLPDGAFSVLPLPSTESGNALTAQLAADERLPVVSFTGSGPVGWSLASSASGKHVVLELGGNAAAVVCADWSDPRDLDTAAQRIAMFGNYQAGQSCIAVQRVIVDSAVADDFIQRLVDAVRSLPAGDPHDPKSRVGPLVDVGEARRVADWISEAVESGATLHTGGDRDGATLTPAVLSGVPRHVKLWSAEAFGPVLAVSTADSAHAAFEQVNDSAYGLQTGVFTHDLRTANQASAELDVGGVIIGDVPSYRADQMPYGGVKGSGMGREGVPAAMHDLTREQVTVFTDLTF